MSNLVSYLSLNTYVKLVREIKSSRIQSRVLVHEMCVPAPVCGCAPWILCSGEPTNLPVCWYQTPETRASCIYGLVPEINHGGKIVNQATGWFISPWMLVSNTDRSIREERTERIEQEPTEKDTSIVSSFVHSGFTTSNYNGRPISCSARGG
jgi:hypothetical protein